MGWNRTEPSDQAMPARAPMETRQAPLELGATRVLNSTTGRAGAFLALTLAAFCTAFLLRANAAPSPFSTSQPALPSLLHDGALTFSLPSRQPASGTGAATVHVASPAQPPARAPWAPPDVPRRPYTPSVERWRPLVRQALSEAWDEGRLDGKAAGLDDDLVLAVIQQESAGDPEAESWAGAIGLMQVMPFTFAEVMAGDGALADAIDPAAMYDVMSNLRAGIRYLALAMDADEGNFYWTLAAYNAGIEAVADWRAVGLYAVPPVGGYVETASYAPRILRNYVRHRPGLQMYIPPEMPEEHVPGAIRLLKDAGLW